MKTLVFVLLILSASISYGVEYKYGRYPERTNSYAYHTRYNKPFQPYLRSNYITPYSRVPEYTPLDYYGRPYGVYRGYGKHNIVFGYNPYKE